jgi:hypothetical protein
MDLIANRSINHKPTATVLPDISRPIQSTARICRPKWASQLQGRYHFWTFARMTLYRRWWDRGKQPARRWSVFNVAGTLSHPLRVLSGMIGEQMASNSAMSAGQTNQSTITGGETTARDGSLFPECDAHLCCLGRKTSVLLRLRS